MDCIVKDEGLFGALNKNLNMVKALLLLLLLFFIPQVKKPGVKN